MVRAARDAAVMAGLAPYAFTLARIAQGSGPERSRWIDLLAVASLVHVTSLCIPYFRDNTAIWLPKSSTRNRPPRRGVRRRSPRR